MSNEGPAKSGEAIPSSSDVTTCIFDIFFDIPHPSASAICERAKIIEPPGRVHPDISELYDPSNISRIPKFAFPDYDETIDSEAQKMKPDSTSGVLNKFDVCCFSTKPKHHTFSLLLDSGTRVHAHVLRYLPIHPAVQTRFDVGRRSERAMILVTRSAGGIGFYQSLLKTLVALGMEAMTLPPFYIGNHDLVKAFLHSIYKKHLVMKKKFNERRVKLGFQKVLGDEDMKITIQGAEFYFLLPPSALTTRDKEARKICSDRMQFIKRKDSVSFQLPNSLQPGYNRSDFVYECESLYSQTMPLLRCLGPAKTIRVLSALLCEHRIILMSKHIEVLSACVCACTAMLAQGLLVWRHVQIPVLPPHLLQYLATEAPYIVGVLEKYREAIETLPGLIDCVLIDLDRGLLKTLYMSDAQKKIPDLLLKKKKKKNAAIEELVNDFKTVLEVERDIWVFPETPDEKIDDDSYVVAPTRKRNLIEKFGLGFMTHSADSDGTARNEKNGFDISDKSTDRYRTYTLSNNERGEELIRASLVSFFLELFGDMGMYLSVNQQNEFCLDTKKFLVRKRQMGAKEDTPVYLLLERLTRSVMFERFTQSQISYIEKNPNLPPVMVCHTPLFQLCQHHLRRQKAKFVTTNIRKVVFTTISACLDRRSIDLREDVRERALALTSVDPFEGEEVDVLTNLIDICRDCDQSFSQVLQVIWLRITDDEPTLWKHPLLGLHLLRNFLLHGPITTISAALGNFERIRILMEYKGKDAEGQKSVQIAARQVYALLKNLCRLFLRRRKVVSSKIESGSEISDDVRWSSYLIRRLPQTVMFAQLHDLVRPCEDAIPRKKITNTRDNFTAIQPQIAVKKERRGSVSTYHTLSNHHIPSNRRNSTDTEQAHYNSHRNISRQPKAQDSRSQFIQGRQHQFDNASYMKVNSKYGGSARNYDAKNFGKEAPYDPSKSSRHTGMTMNKVGSTKENLSNRNGEERIQINSIHAEYRGPNGVLKGFEEVKL